MPDRVLIVGGTNISSYNLQVAEHDADTIHLLRFSIVVSVETMAAAHGINGP